MKLLIQAYEEDSLARLVRWAQFHRMEYEYFFGGEFLSNRKLFNTEPTTNKSDPVVENNLGDFTIIVTSDLVPQTHIFKYILKNEEVGTPCTFIKKNGKWRPSFCVVVKTEDSKTAIYNNNVKMVEDIAVKEPEGPLEMMIGGKMNRFDVIWNIITHDWYKHGSEHISKLYYPFWTENYHKNFIKTGNRRRQTWVREQASAFTHPIDREKIESVMSLSEVLIHIKESKLTINELLLGMKGYTVDVDIDRGMFGLHPFSVHGRYMLNPVRNADVDQSKTLISFYYDLGYSTKPKTVYFESLTYYAKLKYPIIFFGEKDVCDKLLELRGEELGPYTKVIHSSITDWNIVKKFGNDYREMDLEKNFRHRRRYSIMTVTKFPVILEAIRLNPFLSETFVWYDPGIYRHAIVDGIRLEPQPFKNLETPESGITCLGFCPEVGSTDEEFKSGHDNYLAGMMTGTEAGWKSFCEKMMLLAEKSFCLGNFCTEQVLMTRLKSLYPELMHAKEYGFIDISYNRYLELKYHM